MVKTLIEVARELRVAVLELAGAGLVVAGAYQLSRPAGLIVGGVAVLGKSLELDMQKRGERGREQ